MSISSPSLSSSCRTASFRNELDMDIILFGRSYRGKQVGPYTRLLEFSARRDDRQRKHLGKQHLLHPGQRAPRASITERRNGQRKKVGEIPPGNSFGEMALLSGTPRTATVSVAADSGPALVLEFTRPAIRLLRKLPKFGTSARP